MATLKLYPAVLKQLNKAQVNAAIKTANSIRDDVEKDQTVPFLTGDLDRSGTVAQVSSGSDKIQLIYDIEYANYQYFTPGLKHTTSRHRAATDHWLDPYMDGGTKRYFPKQKFAEHLKNEIGRI